ncbi:hypothetical protein BDC45DRAFT_228420 [Circinella umbellata]|nr:hypothetical protein BDC45DRAFT_228420 [Circinella umbellata]
MLYSDILRRFHLKKKRRVENTWSNVIPPEGSVSNLVQVRPDALVCEIDQLSWGRSLGFGEVKLRESKANLDTLGCDLLRLADLTQHASAGLNASFSFQIHAYNLKSYITTTIPNTSITEMLEILSLEFPKTVNDLHSFVSRQILDKLVHLHEVFCNNCLQEKNDRSSQESTLDIAVLHAIKQSSPDRSRKNTIYIRNSYFAIIICIINLYNLQTHH